MKVIAVNRKVRHHYFVEEEWEAGIVLTGSEIKSIRLSPPQIAEAFVSVDNGQLYVKNMFIKQYREANIFNHDETRIRRLLLHRRQINYLLQASKNVGYTIVITKLYFKESLLKVGIALAKGKKLYDKRQEEKERSIKREIAQRLKVKY